MRKTRILFGTFGKTIYRMVNAADIVELVNIICQMCHLSSASFRILLSVGSLSYCKSTIFLSRFQAFNKE